MLKAAKYLFDNQAFDLDPQPQSGRGRRSWADEMDDEEREEEKGVETEEEEERRVKKVRFGKGGAEAKEKGKESAESLDDLIKKLTSLQVHDTSYVVNYAKLVLYYPTVADRLAAPTSFQTGKAAPYAPPGPMRPSYNLQTNGPWPCAFCKRLGCATRRCEVAAQYIREGKIIQRGDWYRWPDNSRIQTHEKGLKFVIDMELERRRVPAASIQEVSAHQAMFVGADAVPLVKNGVESFVVEVEEEQNGVREGRVTEERPVLVVPASAQGAGYKTAEPTSQYKFRSKIEDSCSPENIFNAVLDTPVTLPLRHIAASCPDVRRRMVDNLKTSKVAAPALFTERTEVLSAVKDFNIPYHCPPRELDITLPGNQSLIGVFDTASSLVNIRRGIVEKMRLALNPDIQVSMTMANGGSDSTAGVVENLPITISSITIPVHAHVVDDNAPYDILLGRPFQVVGQIDTKDAGETLIIHDPYKPHHRIHVPTRPHIMPCRHQHPSHYITLSGRTIVNLTASKGAKREKNNGLQGGAEVLVTKRYKPVGHRVRPVPTTLPEDMHVKRTFPEDPLQSLTPLPTRPPSELKFGERLTKERWEALRVGKDGFLWEEEVRLAFAVLKNNEEGLAWTEAEKGRFRDDYFDPVKIPTIEHEPWAERNYPIPPGLFTQIVAIIKDKIASGVFEPSSSSYRSKWFCVTKKNGALRIVHDLQPLNAVTIKDASLPPAVEQYAERCGGRGIYSLGDIFVGYDHRPLDARSRDLTTFQTPLGPHRLTALPMGWTNSVPIFHGDVSFILQDEIDTAPPFIDDVPVLGPRTRYELPQGTYETLPSNPGIRRFVWEHFVDVNRILHRFKHAGATISGKKLFLGVPELTIVGHRCTFLGRIPDSSQVDKIVNWPPCENVSEVRGFLGTCGVVRIFIEKFAEISRPLVLLTMKEACFVWGADQQTSMQLLKDRVVSAPALAAIDYASSRQVILAVDSSVIAVGWILMQEDEVGRRRPSRYGSIAWNEREARYSQAKLELYGLFRALRSSRLHLVGLPRFTVEVDAKYIKGMLNNPDIQPNATINRWIMGIMLFDFDLVHAPAKDHKGPDGLSRRRKTGGDIEEEEGAAEDWVDELLGMGVWVNSWWTQVEQEGENGRANGEGGKEEKRKGEGGKEGKVKGEGGKEERVKQGEGMDGKHKSEAGEEERGQYLVQGALWIPVFFLPGITTADVGIPRSAKDEGVDGVLKQVREFLDTAQRPAALEEKQLRRFLSYTRLFFLKDGQLWRRQGTGYHQLVITPEKRLTLIMQAHDGLGHKGLYSTRRLLLDRFWWPGLERDVAWFIKTCHECQIRSTAHLFIPPTPSVPAPLFRKAFFDTALFPVAQGYRYLVQARCSLTNYPEWTKLKRETGVAVGRFIFESLLCRWGGVETIVTDNGAPIVAGLEWLSKTYHINHIRISPYNKQANGIVERSHRTIRESIVKACEGDTTRWPTVAPFAFWVDRVTVRKATGYSPFYMVHGVEAVLPFDLAEATFLVPKLEKPLTEAELIAVRARQLEKRDGDLAAIHDRVLKARYSLIEQFKRDHAHTIRDYDFTPGSLVLVRNTRVENDLSRKSKPCYLGPMVVVRRTCNGAYILAELTGAVARLPYAAFRLIPYYPRSRTCIDVTAIVDPAEVPDDKEVVVEDGE